MLLVKSLLLLAVVYGANADASSACDSGSNSFRAYLATDQYVRDTNGGGSIAPPVKVEFVAAEKSGNAFSDSTHKFTCPDTAWYYFSVTFSSEANGDTIGMKIVAKESGSGSTEETLAYGTTWDQRDTTTINTVYHCTANEMVWAKADDCGNGNDDARLKGDKSFFIGFRVSPDCDCCGRSDSFTCTANTGD